MSLIPNQTEQDAVNFVARFKAEAMSSASAEFLVALRQQLRQLSSDVGAELDRRDWMKFLKQPVGADDCGMVRKEYGPCHGCPRLGSCTK